MKYDTYPSISKVKPIILLSVGRQQKQELRNGLLTWKE